METIREYVLSYKNNKAEKDASFNQIMHRFKPLIEFDAHRLFNIDLEDARQELICALIESLNRIESLDNEGGIIKYISNSIKYRYLELCDISAKNRNISCTLNTYQEHVYIEHYSVVELTVDIMNNNSLNQRKKQILLLTMRGHTSKEISSMLGVSTQYINRVKKNQSST